ncbi:MAG: hypothetical protein C4529_06415 [Deltaproteobacteria bacterium]|nr:MAG: hypothetical protein C4529_06415 [Deltaproteobacteria bacterium]
MDTFPETGGSAPANSSRAVNYKNGVSKMGLPRIVYPVCRIAESFHAPWIRKKRSVAASADAAESSAGRAAGTAYGPVMGIRPARILAHRGP